MDQPHEITRLLNRPTRSTEEDERLFALIYQELRAAAGAVRGRWSGDATLGVTALVHEAWMRLDGHESAGWESRKHFYVVAARAMRQILLNYTERAGAAKRDPSRAEPLADLLPWRPEETIALHDALTRLEERNPRQARTVELKFFADLTNEEVAEVIGVSAVTVKRDWAFARSWLADALDGGPP